VEHLLLPLLMVLLHWIAKLMEGVVNELSVNRSLIRSTGLSAQSSDRTVIPRIRLSCSQRCGGGLCDEPPLVDLHHSANADRRALSGGVQKAHANPTPRTIPPSSKG
jgi:hypothetical protein